MKRTQIITKRRITFCPFTLKKVNHEITIIENKNSRDIITTCTGVEERCNNCAFLLSYQNNK